MLPVSQRVLFLVFAAIALGFGLRGFLSLYRRIARGRADTDARTNHWPRRLRYALVTTLLQSRTFRKRPWVSFFHSFIFYGFVFYLLVNLVDAVDGFVPLSFASLGLVGQLYVLCADVLSALVLVSVVALVIRRFALPSRHDFTFNERTLLHQDVKRQYVTRDSLIVSAFILFHVGSRAIGAGAKLAAEGQDRYAPFATLLSHLFTPANAAAWRDFGYWGALGSVLLFLGYFPYTKHVHIFFAPVKYAVSRDVSTGVLPAVVLGLADEAGEADEPKLGAERLEDLAWPRLVDAYACIQCNRCQDVCPATATGKALSPSALEINKRMELNGLARHEPGFAGGAPSPRPLLQFALSAEAAWACTTCGACLEACPVQDEPMLDIVDIRREQVMLAGEFPAQLQTAFRGMERAQNPWGINHDKRMDWAAGLNVKTTDENPTPEVLFWVGCAASYDPQSQKTARAFVQLLDHAGVDFAVLGKRECCTGDTARRAGNEYLYRQLADRNVATLNEVRPKLIVATCPHCMNTVGKEYGQLGGDFKVVHHTEFLAGLVAEGRLDATPSRSTLTYHDPCYLGRHNGVYDAPRNVLKVLSNDVVELPRNRENSFCCGAGGAQFWKEEEPGDERISSNRLREVRQTLGRQDREGMPEKTLAVGCPFCKSMLESSPAEADAVPVVIKDVAELLLEGVQRKTRVGPSASSGAAVAAQSRTSELLVSETPASSLHASEVPDVAPESLAPPGFAARREEPAEPAAAVTLDAPARAVARKAWKPKGSSEPDALIAVEAPVVTPAQAPAPARKTWAPKRVAAPEESSSVDTPVRTPGASEEAAASAVPAAETLPPTEPAAAPARVARKTWKPTGRAEAEQTPGNDSDKS